MADGFIGGLREFGRAVGEGGLAFTTGTPLPQVQQQLGEARLKTQQQEAAVGRQQQIQALLAQIQGGQPVPGVQTAPQPTPGGLAPVTAIAPPEVTGAPRVPVVGRTQALAQLAVLDPERFEQINKNLGLITQQQKNEAADFAFRLRNAAPENRDPLIRQRVTSLDSQGRNSSDTRDLLTQSVEEQNQSLETVQIAALSPEQRVEIAREGPAALQNIVEAAGGGFIGIEPTTRESVFIPPPVPGIKTQKQVDAERKTQEERVIADMKASDTTFDRAKKLRSEITNVSTDFNKIGSAFGRIQASSKDPSAAGDLALIFNFMKMLDPGSVVRESEFATAANAAGVPDRIRNQFNRVRTGERLAENQRADFLKQAGNIFDRSEEDNTKAINKIVDIGEQFNVTRDQLLGREQPAPPRLEDLTAQDLSDLSIEELQSLAGGEQ